MSRDPRADSAEKLTPPPPLPYVSRKALRRVTDVVPPPTTCPYCEAEVRLVNHAEIYGREYGDWPYAYMCSSVACGAYVGLHPNTDLPLGTLADKRTREARKSGKRHFHDWQQANGWSRRQAYAWLAGQLGIDKAECHWGLFDAKTAHRAGDICRRRLEGEMTDDQ